MYIIDKNKDYYDYLAGIYGVDKQITYDRRGSIILPDSFLLDYITKSQWDLIKSTEHFVIEIGENQYLFRVEIEYKHGNGPNTFSVPSKGNFSLLKTFKDNKHYYNKEISLVPVNVTRDWRKCRNGQEEFVNVEYYSDLHIIENKIIPNVIFRETIIPSFIDPKEVWIALSNYISSKYNDKTVAIKNTDTDKIINHGFDKRWSFRHPVK
jgi:hypothetical protein